MKTIWETIRASYLEYGGNHLFTVLFFLSAVWMAADRREKEARLHLMWPMLLTGAVIVCPLTAYVIMKLIGSDVYFRTGWMVPLAIPVSYGAVQLCQRLPRRIWRGVAAVVIAAGIAWGGTYGLGSDNFTERTNVFKLPNEAIWISDVIAADAKEQGWTARAVVPDEILCHVRQYDASIRLLYGRNLLKNEVSNQELYDLRTALYNVETSAEKLVEGLRRYRCSYVVIPYADEALESLLGPLGMEKVGEAAGYTVFRDGQYVE